MLQRSKTAALPAILAVGLLLTPAATAAPEGAAQETPPAQALPDDHAYLPPWMRPEASAAPPALEAQYLNALGDPLVKPSPVQRPPLKHRSNTLFGLSLDVFGR